MSNTNGVLDAQVVNENNTYTPDVSTWYDSINGSFYKEDPVNGTDITDSMGDVQIKFMIPEGYIAVLEASLTVDDWGRLDIVSAGESGENHLHLGMMKNVDDVPGPRGGHALWSKHGNVSLPPGEYIIYVYHENATYVDAYADKAKYNISQCDFSITARKFRGACLLNWPADPVSLGTPITWYEERQNKNAVRHRFNSGTISAITAEEFAAMARVIYAEAGTTGEEMKAIASVMLNRLGNSPYGVAYRRPVLSILDEFSQRDSNGKNPNWASVTDSQFASVEGDKCYSIDSLSCAKLNAAISALLSEIATGPSYPYDGMRTAGTTSLNHVTIGQTDFLQERQYAICDVKPSDWDSLPIWPDSPLDH